MAPDDDAKGKVLLDLLSAVWSHPFSVGVALCGGRQVRTYAYVTPRPTAATDSAAAGSGYEIERHDAAALTPRGDSAGGDARVARSPRMGEGRRVVERTAVG